MAASPMVVRGPTPQTGDTTVHKGATSTELRQSPGSGLPSASLRCDRETAGLGEVVCFHIQVPVDASHAEVSLSVDGHRTLLHAPLELLAAADASGWGAGAATVRGALYSHRW